MVVRVSMKALTIGAETSEPLPSSSYVPAMLQNDEGSLFWTKNLKVRRKASMDSASGPDRLPMSPPPPLNSRLNLVGLEVTHSVKLSSLSLSAFSLNSRSARRAEATSAPLLKFPQAPKCSMSEAHFTGDYPYSNPNHLRHHERF